MFETRSECSFFRMASSSALLNLAPGGESTSEALLAQSKTADATRSAGRAGIFATRFGPLGEGGALPADDGGRPTTRESSLKSVASRI